MNILEVLFEHFHSKRLALVSGERSISYNSLCKNAISFSQKINTDSDTVILYMANSIEFAIAYFGVLLKRKKVLLVNPMYPEKEVLKYANMVHGDIIITDSQSSVLSSSAHVMYPAIEEDIEYDPPVISDASEEGAVIIPTSGTTGEAKLIMLTHGNMMRRKKPYNVLIFVSNRRGMHFRSVHMMNSVAHIIMTMLEKAILI